MTCRHLVKALESSHRGSCELTMVSRSPRLLSSLAEACTCSHLVPVAALNPQGSLESFAAIRTWEPRNKEALLARDYTDFRGRFGHCENLACLFFFSSLLSYRSVGVTDLMGRLSSRVNKVITWCRDRIERFRKLRQASK